MATPKRIPKLSLLSKDLIGEAVLLNGWVYGTRTQGAGTLVFVDLGDGSVVTPVRCLKEQVEETSGFEQPDYTKLTFDEMTQASSLTTGCSVSLVGNVKAPPEGTTQTFEIKIVDLWVIGGVKDASRYPIQKSVAKKPLALRPFYHARFRAPLVQQLMKIRSEALFAIHEFFHEEGVPLLDPNIMTSSDCEGAGEVFKVSPQFFHNTGPSAADSENKDAAAVGAEEKPTEVEKSPEVGLTVSSQLPLEAIAMGTGAVYTCQKSFRAEHSDTNKHLAEFLHVEYEEYFISLDDLLTQAERYVKYVVTKVLDRCTDQYKFLNSKHSAPPEMHGHAEYLRSLMEKPFVRITHAEAIDMMLQDLRDKAKTINDQGKEVRLKFKEKPQHGQDLGSEHEKYLVKKYGTFVFVTNWPAGIKSFYMKQVEADGTCECFDLLAPAVGELFGGSMREWRADVLDRVMKERGVQQLDWYAGLRGDGTAPHGGWGMGFDRLVMFLTNAASVRDVVPYPVYYGHCPY